MIFQRLDLTIKARKGIFCSDASKFCHLHAGGWFGDEVHWQLQVALSRTALESFSNERKFRE